MKLKFVVILACLLPAIVATAGDRGERRSAWREKNPNVFTMNFGWGGYPSVEEDQFKYGGMMYSVRDISYYRNQPIASIYEDYRGSIWTISTISGEFNWNTSRWFNASAYLGLCPIWSSTYDGYTKAMKNRDFAMAVFVLPKVKLMYCNSPMVRVYSSISLGVELLPGFTRSDSFIKGAIQFSLVGMEIGRKWFGSFELGAGSVYTGGQIGFGFKF